MANIISFPARRSATTALRLAIGLTICGSVSQARAQSMDYGALQQLFGEPVTMSATGTPQRARDVPADMDIITAEDIRRSGAYDIPGVLKHVLGVDVLRWGVLGADVSVRGYNSPMTSRTLVLIDGRQVYIDDWGRTEWAALPVELAEIRQIEVVKGPNSALFGFNATGGVINIITFNPLYDRVNSATINLGTQGYREVSAVAADKIGSDVGIRLSAGGTLTEDFSSVRDIAHGLLLNHDTSRDQASADLHWQITPRSDLEFQATHSENQHLGLTPIWLPIHVHNQLNSLLARYTTDAGIGVITATAYSNWSNAVGTTRLGSAVNTLSYPTQLTVAQLQDQLQIGSAHTVRLTSEFRHNSIASVGQTGGVVSYNIGSLGAMWNWQVTPTVGVTAAGRGDVLWLNRTGGGLALSPLRNADWNRQMTEPSYNIGLVWHPLEWDYIRLTAARGTQLPSLVALGGLQNLPFEGGSFNSNPAIQPTIVNNYEIDWDHDFADTRIRSRVALFYQTTQMLQSVISPADTRFLPPGRLLIYTGNIGNSREVGAEFSLQGKFENTWHWTIGYSPRIVRDNFNPLASVSRSGVDFAHTTPRHVVKASLGWSTERWEIDGFLNFQSMAAGVAIGRSLDFGLVPLGAVVAFDARAAYKLTPSMTLSLSGQDILFSSARQTGWSKTEQQLIGQFTAHF